MVGGARRWHTLPMPSPSRSGETERLIRRFAEACARRDALLDSCRRAMTALVDAGQLLDGVESTGSYSIDATRTDAEGAADAIERMPAYPSRADLRACLRDLAAVSAEIRALRPALGASPLAPARSIGRR
jgi:hypothetical protein